MRENYIAGFFVFRIPSFGFPFCIRDSDFVISKRSLLRFEHLDERLLRNVDFPDAFHAFFPFFLFLQ
jgi:hypothetical protein